MENIPDTPLPRWYFQPLGPLDCRIGLTDNADLLFKGKLATYLMREICQNSLDETRNKKEPVTVEFKFLNVRSRDFPEIFKVAREYVAGADLYRRKDTTRAADEEFLKDADAMLGEETVPVLLIRDFGTRGLPGIGKRDGGKWDSLVMSDGFSNKSEGSGGSKGVGKAAAYVCSRAKTVFYGTRCADGVGFYGRFRLPPLYDPDSMNAGKDPVELQSFGHFCVVASEKTARPITENDNFQFFRKYFLRGNGEENYGTDVVVIGVKEEVVQERLLELPCVAICNFFPAIVQGHLIVKIGDDSGREETISAETISDKLGELIQRYGSEISKAGKRRANQLSKNLSELRKTEEMLNAMRSEPKELPANGEGNIVKIWHAESEAQCCTLFTRSAGMKIMEKPDSCTRGHVAVVCVERKSKLHEILRAAENAKHDKWLKRRSSKEERARTEAILAFEDVIKKFIDEEYKIADTASIGAGTGITLGDIGDETEKKEQEDPLNSRPKFRSAGSGSRPGNSVTIGADVDGGGDGEGGGKGKKDKKKAKKPRGGTGNGAGTLFGLKPAPIQSRIFAVSGKPRVFSVWVRAMRDLENVSFRFLPEVESGKRKDSLRFLESPTDFSFAGTARSQTSAFPLRESETKMFYVKFEPLEGLDFTRCAIGIVATEHKAKGESEK